VPRKNRSRGQRKREAIARQAAEKELRDIEQQLRAEQRLKKRRQREREINADATGEHGNLNE